MGNQVSAGWKYATFALVGVIILQAWWWDRQAPQVLGLHSGR
jgi:hypothetical protein